VQVRRSGEHGGAHTHVAHRPPIAKTQHAQPHAAAGTAAAGAATRATGEGAATRGSGARLRRGEVNTAHPRGIREKACPLLVLPAVGCAGAYEIVIYVWARAEDRPRR
jgi:hypothetical protein